MTSDIIYYLVCRNCGHEKSTFTVMSEHGLIKPKMTPSHDQVNCLINRFKCSKCGSKTVEIKAKLDIKAKMAYASKKKKKVKRSKKAASKPAIKRKKNDMPVSHIKGLCIDCGKPIRPARLNIDPGVQRCVQCQSSFERSTPAATKRMVDEGLAGSREDHKKLRAREWGAMMNRHR